MNYKDLDYPMFETTFTEKCKLFKVLVSYYLGYNSSVFLCHNLRKMSDTRCIRKKIQKILSTLEGYLGMGSLNLGVKDREKLRKIWIRRLLSYNAPKLELQPA